MWFYHLSKTTFTAPEELIDYKTGADKQVRLLAQDDGGHFSMVRALHLADAVTALNGSFALRFFSVSSR